MIQLEEQLTTTNVVKLWEKHDELFLSNIVDLTKVDEIDSSGIAFLVLWAKKLESKKLKIKVVDGKIKKWLELFSIGELFEFV
ncbi:MAG: STAS domain-containing protein [Succinivibrionaceae bacterium]|nr:STAS domain-containing protein [Ruminobacter sp.]MDY5778652.1 STAS domain-containing protein [Succinivibrionaceae bacterium]MEE1340466.1 STAS domain-containing protein [Succinivibrionaceae bacterium]